MGLNLRIIPAYNSDANFGVSSLEFVTDYDLFEQIKEIQKKQGKDVDRQGFTGYMGDNFQKTDKDAYGEVLQSVRAIDFRGVIMNNYSAVNKATLDYIRALEDNAEIYLYWH